MFKTEQPQFVCSIVDPQLLAVKRTMRDTGAICSRWQTLAAGMRAQQLIARLVETNKPELSTLLSYDIYYSHSEMDSGYQTKNTREECMHLMSQPDYIMEPGILNTVKRFLGAGGKLVQMIEVLSSNYSATAQMVNLFAEWLIMTGMRVDEVQSVVEDHLKQMIIKHFDPKKADRIFTDENDENATPSWLTEIIGHPSWRSLIYKLAEMYPDCMMLQFTIKLISDAGFQGEITSISTASQQLDVFARILRSHIVNILAGTQDTHEKHMLEFCKMVCHGEHTYLYSQAILYILAKGNTKSAASIKRLSQEVVKYALENHHHGATPITMALTGVTANARIHAALSSMLAKNTLNPADMTALYREYKDSVASNSNDAPFVSFIRVPLFLDLVLDSLFKPGSKINPEHRHKYIFLLAYAVSVIEQTKKGSQRRLINRDQLEYTIQAIDKVVSICQEKRGSLELLCEVGTLYEYLKIPTIAMGILQWVKYTVSEPSYFQLSTEHTPIHLAFLDEVTTNHNTLHEKVLGLLTELMTVEPEDIEVLQQLQVKRVIIDRMVHLVSKNYIIPVVKYMHSCWQKLETDVSLIRYFVTEVLEIIEPPFSQEFTSLMLPLAGAQEVTGNLSNENKEHHLLVRNFLSYCQQ